VFVGLDHNHQQSLVFSFRTNLEVISHYQRLCVSSSGLGSHLCLLGMKCASLFGSVGKPRSALWPEIALDMESN
jgi:hypothetical protein